MIEITGDFWSHLDQNRDIYDAICCTTNTVVKLNGELVMGAGIAKDFANEYSWLPKHWGERVKKQTMPLVLVTLMKKRPHLVSIPTKIDWKQPSPLDLIWESITELSLLTEQLGWKKILLPRPGCKNGGLSWKEQVRPILLQLDDRFVVINNGT